MSAWSIGSLTAVTQPAAGGPQVDAAGAAETPPLATVDTLITWIPGEVIAGYAAIILALQPDPSDDMPTRITSGWWLVATIVAAGVLTWLGGWSKTNELTTAARKELTARVVLAGAAFAIWSFVIPGSWWYSIDTVADNSTLIPILAGIVGLAFSLFAEGLVRRVGK